MTAPSRAAPLTYDGLGRRVKKAVQDCGDWNATYEYYCDSAAMVEMRDDSEDVLKQYVWGQTYVDELVQIAVNHDPTDAEEDDCESEYYALQDANYNVLGLVDADDGDLAERYEYTPYGQRTVFKSAGSDDALCMAALMESQRVEVSSVAQSYGLCDVGHQGLLHDKETGLIHNRARTVHPRLGRFLQRDPLEYVDGMSLYEYVGSAPLGFVDPSGAEVKHHGGWCSGWGDTNYWTSYDFEDTLNDLRKRYWQSRDPETKEWLWRQMQTIACKRDRHYKVQKECPGKRVAPPVSLDTLWDEFLRNFDYYCNKTLCGALDDIGLTHTKSYPPIRNGDPVVQTVDNVVVNTSRAALISAGLVKTWQGLWRAGGALKAAIQNARQAPVRGANGIVAQNGTRVTGFTRHGINRAIGDGAKRAGTKPQAILDALENPQKIVSGVDKQGRPFQIFTGQNARVVVNPQTGNVVSVNPLSGAGAH